MKKLLLILLIAIVARYSYAQQKKIDSLKRAVAAAGSKQSAILLTAKLAHSYLYYKPDSSYSLAREALGIARQTGYLEGEAQSQKVIGEAQEQMGNYTGALQAYLEHLKIAEKLDIPYSVGQALTNISLIYEEQEEYRQAINYTLKAKKVIESVPAAKRVPDYDLTRDAILLNAGFMYYKLHKLDSALVYEQAAYQLALKINAEDYMGNILQNLGLIQQDYHNTALALTYFRMSLQKSKLVNDFTTLTDTYLKLADFYEGINKTDSCVYYAKQALATSKAALYLRGELDASTILANNYATVDKGLAYTYLKTAAIAKDSLFSQSKVKELQSLQYEEKARQQELAELKQTQEEERKNNLQMSAIALFIPVFFLTALLLSKTRLHFKVIEFMSVLTILFSFEFITLLLHPVIKRVTNDTLILEFIVFVCLAGVITPMHHRFTHWLKEKLAHAHKWGEKPNPRHIAENHESS